ncbi:MAG: hypothetical protein OEZ59_12605 [Deltaproteobacteria bacterium]|nr:hypothetical protein [Deltaproteobacteria bacterium]
MNVLGQFIHHEFQRNFDQSVDDGSFFSRVEDCRSAGLLAKWLSELKRGAYGALPKPWEFPDVVFFGTEEDRGQNDREFFYPAISCAELFGEGEAGSLYEGADFDFSVFMEEQLTLAEHKARQETGREPGPEQLREQIRKSGAALAKKKVDLKAASKAISERDSEVYRQLLYREEVAYRKRYEGFSQDMEKVSQEMQTLTAEYRELAARIAPMLKNSGLEPGELLKADPENPRKSEERLNRLAGQEEERLFKLFGERSLGFQGFVREWERQLLKFPQIFKSLLENHRVWQKGREAGRGFELASGWKKRLEGAVQALKGQSPADLGPRARLVETQLRNLESDLEQQQARLDAQNRKNIQVAASLLVLVRRSMDRLEISAPQPNPQGVEDILAELDKLSSRYADISRMASQMAPRVLKLLEAREQDRVKRERLLEQREKLSLENAALAVAAGAADPPAPALTGETVDDGQLRLAEKTFREMQERLRQAPQMLEECSKKSAESLRLARGEGASYSRLFARRREAARMTSRLYRLRLSRKSLEQRKTLMEKELAELPELVRQKFMPARNRLINEVFLPEAERRSRNLVKVDLLVNKVLGLSRESLWGMYLDRAVARRFHARHFLRGCLIGHDINSHEYPKLRNIEAGLKLFARTLRHNYNLNQLEGMQVSDFQFLPPEKGPAIIKRLESIASQSRLGLTFMVLPVTMPFREALDIIKRKEVIFQGVPRLVLVYISKFDGSLLLRDPLARHSYFSALKHNVVLNVDGRLLVDNPRAIAGRLLSDTFGCAYDIRQIEELSDDESALGAAG